MAHDWSRAEVLVAIAKAQAGLFDAAQSTAAQIEEMGYRAEALMAIAEAQVQCGKYDYTSLLQYNEKIPGLINLIHTYLDHNQVSIAHTCVFDLWRAARSRDVLMDRLPLIIPLIATNHALIHQLIESFAWVDEQLKLT